MTLILALACSEGLVVASDGQATYTTSSQPTKLPIKKLYKIGTHIVWGASGDIGLQQKIAHALEKEHHPQSLKKSIKELRPKLVSTVIPILQAAAKNYIDMDKSLPPPTADILFAGVTDGRPRILEVARNGSDMQHEDQGFYAVGSGDIFARYAHQSLLHLGVKEKALYQCQMVAYRVIDTAIETAAYGLGPPIQMWLIKKEEDARELGSEELAELRDTVGVWKNAEAESLAGIIEKRSSASGHSEGESN